MKEKLPRQLISPEAKLIAFLENNNVRPNSADEKSVDELLFTLVTVLYIRNEFPQDHELWELVVDKAEHWVASIIANKAVRAAVWDHVRNIYGMVQV
jgi:hypothetical protein